MNIHCGEVCLYVGYIVYLPLESFYVFFSYIRIDILIGTRFVHKPDSTNEIQE
jgi:hypothetical protein